MLNLQTKQSDVHPTAGDIKSNPFHVCFCKALTPILAMLLFASGAWGLQTYYDSQIGTSETPKNLVVTGKLGVGTSSPTNELEVNGSVEVSSSVQALEFIGDGSKLTGLDIDPEGLWNTNGSNIFYTNRSVGIGTSYPARTLEVNGTIKASLFEGEGIYWKKIPDSGNQGIYYNDGNVKRVGIGTNSPKERLHVIGNIRLGQGTPSEGTINRIIHVKDNNTVHIGSNKSDLDGRFVLTVGGNVNVVGGYYRNGELIEADENFSDSRLKKNIKPIENVLPKLQQIDGVYFDWEQPKHDAQKRRQIGVIAQAVEAQFPELVTGGDGYKSVAYGPLSAVLIEAVKQLDKTVKVLKINNHALESKVTELTARIRALEAN